MPIDGVAPADATVFDLRYPAAYPITYVVPRRPHGASRFSGAMMKGFTDWLRSEEAAKLFRARGMMLVADGPPPAPDASPRDEAPPQDEATPSDDAIPVEEPPPGR